MKRILEFVISRIDPKIALLYVWSVVHAKLKAKAIKTPEEWDDEGLEILDGLIRDLAKA